MEQDSLCQLIVHLNQISERERKLQAIDMQVARLELENLFADHVDKERLNEKEVLVQNFISHLNRINDLEADDIARRLRAPSEENHIPLHINYHSKMIELVEGAFTDVLRSREDVELAKWSHDIPSPSTPLVRSARLHFKVTET